MIRAGNIVRVINSDKFEELVGQTGVVLSRSNDGKSFMVRFDRPKGRTDFDLKRNQITKLEEA